MFPVVLALERHGSRVDHNLNGSNHPLDGLAY